MNIISKIATFFGTGVVIGAAVAILLLVCNTLAQQIFG